MGSIRPDPKKRSYVLPHGCKDLIDVLKGHAPKPTLGRTFRVNGRIRSREVRVIGQRGERLGVMRLGEAIQLAASRGIDLVEIGPEAKPPICRLVDYGKFRFELSTRGKSKS
jgi:translation initiation factor IF-3